MWKIWGLHKVVRMKKIVVLGVYTFLVLCLFVASVRAVLVFYDDFERPDGALGSDWTVVSGDWGIESGESSQNNTDLLRAHTVAGDSSLTNFVVEAKAKIVDGLGVIVLFRYVDSKNWYEAFIRQDIDVAVISRFENGKINWIASKTFVCETDTWYLLKVEAFSDLIRFYVNDQLVLEATDSTFTNGKVGIGSLDAHAHFDYIQVNNPSFNVVPEPEPLITSVILVAAFVSYMLLRQSKR